VKVILGPVACHWCGRRVALVAVIEWYWAPNQLAWCNLSRKGRLRGLHRCKLAPCVSAEE